MTTRPIAQPATPPIGEFPTPPPRLDMQNYSFLYEPNHPSALGMHLFGRDVLITAEAPLGWRAGRGVDFVVPDLLIAFGGNATVLKEQNGYSISYQGKPPDFVLEVASKTTARNDEEGKRRKYAEFGVPEYWRFDDTDGEYYQASLAGDRLVNGEYHPIPVDELSWARIRGYSAALNLYVCWEYGNMRFFDPARQLYLPSYQEQTARADAAEERIRELEAENRRLRGQP